MITIETPFEEVKEAWIKALESGDYIQGCESLTVIINNTKLHCCIGVLGEIVTGLSNNSLNTLEQCPYNYLNEHITKQGCETLYEENDRLEIGYGSGDLIAIPLEMRNYSNVIPAIKELKSIKI